MERRPFEVPGRVPIVANCLRACEALCLAHSCSEARESLGVFRPTQGPKTKQHFRRSQEHLHNIAAVPACSCQASC